MKKFFQYLFLVIALSIWGIILTNKEQARETVRTVSKEIGEKINPPCSKPLKYSIGSVDAKFGISPEQLIKISEEAEGVWEKASEKNLLDYDPDAKFRINLIFDQRQAQTAEAEELNAGLKNLEASREKVISQYESVQSVYEKKLKIYNNNLEEYREKLEKYNETIKYWNKKGGVSQAEYDNLQEDKEELDDLYDALKAQQKEINNLAGKSNTLASQENKIVNQYNSGVNTYKNKYGDSQEFEKGIFDGEEINIYQFQAAADLRLTLAHEFGHYLGFMHTENSASIMYYLIGDQDLENIAPTKEDLAEIKKICKIN